MGSSALVSAAGSLRLAPSGSTPRACCDTRAIASPTEIGQPIQQRDHGRDLAKCGYDDRRAARRRWAGAVRGWRREAFMAACHRFDLGFSRSAGAPLWIA